MTSAAVRGRPLQVGVIGVGRIGKMHAKLLSCQVPGAELAGVSDVVVSLADEVGRELGAPALSTDSLLADPAIGAVAICSSTDTHVALIAEAARQGKAIFCEKPVSLDLRDVDEAIAAAGAAGVPLMVGFNRRFDPSHAAVREAVRDGRLGPAHIARITSRDPAPPPLSYARVSGGIFLDMTVHDFDIARYIVGSEVVRVHAAGATRIVPELAEMGDIDTAVVTLWHQDGCITVIDNSRQATYGYDQRIEVLGSKGLAASDNPVVNTGVFRDASGGRLATLPYFFIERYTAAYINQWAAFVDAVCSGRAVPTSGADARAALVLGLAAKLSLKEGRPVRTDEVDGSGEAAGSQLAGASTRPVGHPR
ncbi:MAG TPA: inositol 2-dehydrogenase [Acidimicrobiales bacterium]|nr:inositol 2-dehydrogenase [Acidimicrobiales bacterium]